MLAAPLNKVLGQCPILIIGHSGELQTSKLGPQQAQDGKKGGFDAAVGCGCEQDEMAVRVAGQLTYELVALLTCAAPATARRLGGSMSLVGPRPLPDYEVAEYQPWHYERLCAWPGITGLWQIEGRGKVTFDDGTRLDIEYVRRRSLLFDLRILFRTVPAVLSKRGAR